MGLRLTLSKENNSLFTEFKDAYWVVTNVSYSLTSVSFNLICYPSRGQSTIATSFGTSLNASG